MRTLAALVHDARAAGFLVGEIVVDDGVFSVIQVNSVGYMLSLPEGTLVRDRDGDVWERIDPTEHRFFGDGNGPSADETWALVRLNGRVKTDPTDFRTSSSIFSSWAPIHTYDREQL